MGITWTWIDIIGLAITTIGVGVAICAVRVSVSALREHRRLFEEERRERRVDKVVTKYCELKDASMSSEFHGLLRAGIKRLRNDEEYREVIEELTSIYGGSPLVNLHDEIMPHLKAFFDQLHPRYDTEQFNKAREACRGAQPDSAAR